MTGELEGQVAIVTGGGRGIGRAIALALAAAGAAVTVTARTREQLCETVSQVEAAGGRALAVPADVTDREAVTQVVVETEQRFGPVDTLVNNAGGANLPVGPLWEMDPEMWRRDIEVNFYGTFLPTHAVLPGMVTRGRGRIINIASTNGLFAVPFMQSYGCAKAAVIRLTNGLAAETAPHGVCVFALPLGWVDTEMAAAFSVSPAFTNWFGGRALPPREQWSSPERIGALCVFLASGRADALSGRAFRETEDLGALVERAEEIQRDDLFALRLRM